MALNRLYELMFILSGELKAEVEKVLIQKIENTIKGKIVEKNDWGIKEFSYELKKEKKGHYIIYYIETEIDNIEKIKHLSRIDKGILRLMVIKHEEWPFVLNAKAKDKDRKNQKEDISKEKQNPKYKVKK